MDSCRDPEVVLSAKDRPHTISSVSDTDPFSEITDERVPDGAKEDLEGPGTISVILHVFILDACL